MPLGADQRNRPELELCQLGQGRIILGNDFRAHLNIGKNDLVERIKEIVEEREKKKKEISEKQAGWNPEKVGFDLDRSKEISSIITGEKTRKN